MKVQMKKVAYGGWPNCIHLTNGEIELVATTDVGPRIIRFGPVGGPNLLKEFADQMGRTGDADWLPYGGHRFWHAPEIRPRSYVPDNTTIESRWDGRTLHLIQPTEALTGLQKELEITLDPKTSKVTVLHRLRNHGAWDVEAAPWALTVMAGPGRAIFPQEPAVQQLLPVRPLVLWGYTDMRDPRWTWGTKYIRIKSDPKMPTAQKVGLLNKPGWAAYTAKGLVFIKRFPFDPAANYLDYGCNCECYTAGDMLEVESVGPLAKIAPGGLVEHAERWYLFSADLGESEKSLDEKLLPLVAKAK